MAEPKSFQDYLQQAQASLGTSRPRSLSSTGGVDLSQVNRFGMGVNSNQAQQGTQDALSWVVDILTRPLSGVTNTIQKTVNAGVDATKAFTQGDIGGALSAGFGAVSPNLNFLEGMFSTDPNTHRTFSEVIEQSTDKIGTAFDPNYVDVQDNVNPVAKGVVGFAGDVLLDPLTWLPGAAIAKGAQTVARGAKATAGALSGALRGSEGVRAAERAGEGALAAAAKTPRPTAATAKVSQAERASTDAPNPLQHLVDDPDLRARALADPALASQYSDVLRETARMDINRAVDTDAGREVAKALDMFRPLTFTERVGAKIPTLAEAKPLPFGETGAVSAAGTAKGKWLTAAANSVSKSPTRVAFQHAGEVYDMGKVLPKALAGDSSALKIARAFYDNYYIPRFAEGKANKQWVDVLGRPTQAPKPAKTTTTTILDSLGAYRKYKAESVDKVTAALGPALVRVLDSYTNPANFDKVVNELRTILDGSLDVTTLRELKAPTKSLLETLGVKPASIPTAMRKPKGEPNPAPVGPNLAATAAEQVAKMGVESARAGRVDFDTALSMAQQGLDNGVFRDLLKRNVDKAYPHKTNKGTHRTAELYGDGMARILKQANEYFQWNLWKGIFEPLNKMGMAEKLYGIPLAQYKSEWGRSIMRIQERALDEHGVPLVMGVGDDTIPLAMSQLLDVLEAGGARTMHRTFWNGGTAVPPTNLMDAAVIAVKGGDRDAIEAALRQTETRHRRSNGAVQTFPNNLTRGGAIGKVKVSGEVLVKELTDLIESTRSTLRDVVADNAASFQARRMAETGRIADTVLGELEGMFQARQGFGDLLHGIDDMSTRVRNLSETFGTTQDATNMANAIVKAVIPPGDQAAAKGAVATAKAVDEALELGPEAAQKAYEANARALLDELGVTLSKMEDMQDVGTVIGTRMHNSILRKIMPVFSRTWGMDKAAAAQFLRREGTYRTALTHYTDQLNAVARSGLSVQDINNLLKNAIHGLPGKEHTAAVQATLGKLWGSMFGTGPASITDNAFLRNGDNLAHVNDVFRANNLPESIVFDVEAAVKASATKGGSVAENIARQAAEWDLGDDPINLMFGLYKSFLDVQVQHTIAQDFVKIAGDLGAFADEAKAGFVKYNPADLPKFSPYLGKPDYIQSDVLDHLKQVDNLWQQSMDMKGPLGNFIRNVYQPALQAWKYGMTLPNPTHHVRNGVSDLSLTALAEGFNPAMHKRGLVSAFQAMATRNSYDSTDAVRMLNAQELLPDAGHLVSKGALAPDGFTADALYTAMANRGNLLSYRYLEHINDDKVFGEGTGALARLWESAQNTTPVRAIGGVSEWRDHFVRLQHAAIFIEKNIDNTKAYKTLDDLLDAASNQVRKWHPDGTDLTRAEQYFRLIIPFYSWQRKAIPLILESLLTHPGRITMLPKAQFNAAVAMGVNPDSLSDPFPQDQLFPSFMTEQITGPMFKIDGKYYGVNPGFASNDILNEWVGANPIRSLAGMTSPYIKVPFELLTGAQVGTGARINDYSDYIDSNTPLVGALSRMTGTSVTGTILQGGVPDPQYQIRKGNYAPGERETIGALNWLTGAGIQPMSTPSQINYAEIEKRNAAGERNAEDTVREWLLR